MSDKYMYELIIAVKQKAKEDVQLSAMIIGTMAGSEEAYAVYGSEEEAFKAATKCVNESRTFEEALDKFEKEITK